MPPRSQHLDRSHHYSKWRLLGIVPPWSSTNPHKDWIQELLELSFSEQCYKWYEWFHIFCPTHCLAYKGLPSSLSYFTLASVTLPLWYRPVITNLNVSHKRYLRAKVAVLSSLDVMVIMSPRNSIKDPCWLKTIYIYESGGCLVHCTLFIRIICLMLNYCPILPRECAT